MISYIGTTTIAAWFQVTPRCVNQWVIRYPDFPAADVEVTSAKGSTRGWLITRKPEIDRWYARRVGQGSRTDLR